MTEKEKTNYFIELYIVALRAYCNNWFLKEPNPNSERYKQLDMARKIVDELRGEYADYINLQFQIFRKLKIAPKPHHLISIGAVRRYKSHQKKYNIYDMEDYTTNGDFLTIKKTRKIYSISQILLPTNQDTLALHAYNLSKMETWEDLSKDEKNRDAIIYLIIKLKYKEAIIPESIKEIAKKLDLNY